MQDKIRPSIYKNNETSHKPEIIKTPGHPLKTTPKDYSFYPVPVAFLAINFVD